MKHFADRLIAGITNKKTPCIVGLDPRIDMMPRFLGSKGRTAEAITKSIVDFNRLIIETVADLVPAVKLQIAFYEQYGLPGLDAFVTSVAMAKERGLLVIVDAKRNDIADTAEAYATAFLAGRSQSDFGFDVDCITVSPFLGRDSVEPFVDACVTWGKGIFVLVKTSNPGSGDLQDQVVGSGRRVYEELASMTNELGQRLIGASGYSSIGAVVGATFPAQAGTLRGLMPNAIILVPGYGAQGGTAAGAAASFNSDGLGAVVNASRSITYPHRDGTISEDAFRLLVRERIVAMIDDVRAALEESVRPRS